MTMEELSERALLKNLQKEQERERRRMRDRQRRQSMSVEEREKHLARRRRNYQLRRQRAETARVNPQFNKNSILNGGEMLMFPNNETIISVPDVNAQCNGVAHIVSDQRQESTNAGHANTVGLEVPAHILAELPRRVRLNHIKRLARSLKDPVNMNDNQRVSTDLIMKGNETSSCVPPKGLRLHRVKQLARALNSDVTETTAENHQSETGVEQNLSSGDLPMSSNLPKVVHFTKETGEDE